MKKTISVLLLALMLLSLTACKNTGSPEEQLPAENQSQTFPVNYYRGDHNAESLISEPAEIPELSAENLLELLISQGVIPKGVGVKSFSEDGSSLQLDMSESFGRELQAMGTAGEYIMLGALVNTFLDAYSADEILITVEGESLASGHNIYDYPLNFFA